MSGKERPYVPSLDARVTHAMAALHLDIVRAAYERGLRRGLAIARENEGYAITHPAYNDVETVDWDAATEQMEREIEEAKR